MSILRDNCDERRTRVDRMIDEFREAQSRRLAKATAVKGNDEVVESHAFIRAHYEHSHFMKAQTNAE